MSNVRVACAGAWHSHAKDFANRLAGIPHCELAAVWDSDPETAKQWAAEKGCRCYTDYDEMVHADDIDAVIVTAPTVEHADLLIKAAQAGKNIYVEKALTATVAQAKKLQRVVHEAEAEHGVRFVMSDPVQKGAVLYAKELIDSGKFGNILCIRSRNGHDLVYKNPSEVYQYQIPEESGGGVLLDMGHHSVHILHFLLGKPDTAVGAFASVGDLCRHTGAEDFCHIVYQYKNGTVGIAEGGLVTPRFESGLEIVGDKGYLISTADGIRCQFDGEEAYTAEADALPESWTAAQKYWIECIYNNIPCEKYGIDEAVEIMEMIEAAYKSKGLSVKV